ncbi:MAG TPA: DUF2130 domain-containing protein [Chitinophagaceae bacterium]|jgi:hypothetical protein|nr:DUF2130 domain-containing protein [Chitinophagaceae bacterium]
MSTQITCPHCHSPFALEDVLTEDVEKSLKQQYEERFRESTAKLQQERSALLLQQKAFEEKKQRENELFSQRLEKEKQKMHQEVQEQIRKSVAGDYENRVKIMEQTLKDNEEKLKLARDGEMRILQLQKLLKDQKEEMDFQLQKKLMETQKEIEEQASKRAQETHELKLKEKEHQIEQMKKLIEEMKRKSDQTSMQLQGEVQELALEEILRVTFPYDAITEIGKGVRGADAIQVVKNHLGQPCGSIIYESKRTQAFSDGWIEKLKTDMRNTGADIAIIVTQVMPRDMERFGQKSGVWVCNFHEAVNLAHVLRDGLIKIHQAMKSQENKGEKMQMLYDFLTGNEFHQQVEAIVEGFMQMKNGIIKERMQMEKIWKEREKQLEKVILNTTHMYGSVKGIAGSAISEVKLLEGGDDQ